LQILRQVLAADSGCDGLENADFTIGSGDPIAAALELDVDLASLERETCDLAASSMMSSVALPMIVVAGFIDRPE
jgi:hypothetical protein